MNIIEKIFGTHSEREVKLVMPLVEKIEGLRPKMMEMSDSQLRALTIEYKKRYSEERALIRSFPRLMRLCVRQQDVCLTWSIIPCSSSVVSSFIRDVSQR